MGKTGSNCGFRAAKNPTCCCSLHQPTQQGTKNGGGCSTFDLGTRHRVFECRSQRWISGSVRTRSCHRQKPTGRQDWFDFRCRHGKDRRGSLSDSWRQSLIEIIDEPSPRPRQRLQLHQPSPGVHPAIGHCPAHLNRGLQLPAHPRPLGLRKILRETGASFCFLANPTQLDS